MDVQDEVELVCFTMSVYSGESGIFGVQPQLFDSFFLNLLGLFGLNVITSSIIAIQSSNNNDIIIATTIQSHFIGGTY